MFIVKTTTGSQEYGDKLSELLYAKDIKSAYIFWFSVITYDENLLCADQYVTIYSF